MSTSYTTKTCIFFGCNEHLSHYNQLQYSRQPLAIGRFPIVGSCGSMVGLFYLHSLFLNALLPFLSQFIWITFLIQTFSSLPHTPISTTHFLYFFLSRFHLFDCTLIPFNLPASLLVLVSCYNLPSFSVLHWSIASMLWFLYLPKVQSSTLFMLPIISTTFFFYFVFVHSHNNIDVTHYFLFTFKNSIKSCFRKVLSNIFLTFWKVLFWMLLKQSYVSKSNFQC